MTKVEDPRVPCLLGRVEWMLATAILWTSRWGKGGQHNGDCLGEAQMCWFLCPLSLWDEKLMQEQHLWGLEGRTEYILPCMMG